MNLEDVLSKSPYRDFISPIEFRACVGNNSGITINNRDCSIIDGYRESVDFLFTHITNGNATTDTLVYPLIFNCRHSVELSLKVLIRNLIIVYKKKNKIKTTNELLEKILITLKSHDIKSLVESLDKLKDFDKSIIDVISKIKYFYESLEDYYFDIDGDSFRYTYKKNYKDVNLVDVELIDLGILYEKYKNLIKGLDYLINIFTPWLNKQYYQNSFTNKLNRSTLEEISYLLPKKNSWRQDIRKSKENICKKYSISNSEFDKAIKIIKAHYKFSSIIGLENKFKDIKEKTFKKIGEFINCHRNLNRVESKNIKYFNIADIGKYSLFDKNFHKDGIMLFKKINKKEILTLLVFYNFSLNYFEGNYLCEDLDFLYKSMEVRNINIKYALSKICFMIMDRRLKKALENCGQITYLKWYEKYIDPFVQDIRGENV